MNGAGISTFQGDLDPTWFDQWDFVIVRAFDRHGNLDDAFHRNWNNAKGRTLRTTPVHDWASHSADAFRQFAMYRMPAANRMGPIPYKKLNIV